MKSKPNHRGLGNLLIWIALIGVIFSIFGMGTTWYFRPRIQAAIFTIIDSLDQILVNTKSGLDVLEVTLEGAAQNLDVISATLDNLTNTIDNITLSLDSSADLIGGDLRDTIIDTQVALSSAATSAGLVDNTLRFIASIPLLGADYRPEVPLSTSLENVAESMSEVPQSFLEIESVIRETQTGMEELQADINVLSADIRDYEDALFEAQVILIEYDLIFTDIREQLINLRQQTADFLLIASILLTGGFFLLGIAQINTLQLGKTYRNSEIVTVNLAELQRE